MTLRDPKVREAKAILAADRKAIRKARPARVIPTAPEQRRVKINDKPFLAYLRRQPCCVGPVGCSGPTEAAHIRTSLPGEPPTGLQRKPDDRRATPLCQAHHREQHSMSELAWWRSKGRDPYAIAAAFYVKHTAPPDGLGTARQNKTPQDQQP